MINKKIITSLLGLTILFSVLQGCVPSKPTEEVEILAADRLVTKLEANRRKIRTFDGSGSISVQTPSFSNSASFNIIVSKPDSIYLSIEGPFGIELANALITKQNFQFYNAMGNTLYRGETSSDILKEIFRLNISFNDLLDALVGSVNLTQRLYKVPDDYMFNQNQYEIAYLDSSEQSKVKYIVDLRDLGIREFTIQSFSGTEILKGIYSGFTSVEGVAIPKRIVITNKKDKQTIEINYSDFKVNDGKTRIKFEYPEDADIIDL